MFNFKQSLCWMICIPTSTSKTWKKTQRKKLRSWNAWFLSTYIQVPVATIFKYKLLNRVNYTLEVYNAKPCSCVIRNFYLYLRYWTPLVCYYVHVILIKPIHSSLSRWSYKDINPNRSRAFWSKTEPKPRWSWVWYNRFTLHSIAYTIYGPI